MSDTENIRHLGIIMDGNRRWAKARKLPVIEGHRAGFKALKKLMSTMKDNNIEYASVYAFSTENWKRSKEEVQALMGLARWVFKNELHAFNKEDIRLRVAGSRVGVPEDIVTLIDSAEEKTKDNKSGTLVICFNYGGQEEIADAYRKMLNEGIGADDVTTELIEQHLYLPDVPPIDLLIRTSGEQRLSNFMLWRSAYAELDFTDTLWPDFDKDELGKILEKYIQRNRRFGV